MGALLRLKSDIEKEGFLLNECEEALWALSSVKAADFDSRDSGKGSLSVGCMTFSAFSGAPVEDQISEEVAKWKRARERALVKSSNHRWVGVDLRIMASIDQAIIDFVTKSRSPVPEGKIRQYFVAETSDHKARVLEVIEMDEQYVLDLVKRKKISRGDLASTDKMRRGNKFFVGALSTYLTKIKDNQNKLKDKLDFEMASFLGRQNIEIMESHRWSESLTDVKSKGGFLVKTDVRSSNMKYCPECFKLLMESFRVAEGKSAIALPHLPDLDIELQVRCTENRHRDHTLDDCLEVDFMEREINHMRGNLGKPWHRTHICHVPNKSLKEMYGSWLWLKSQ